MGQTITAVKLVKKGEGLTITVQEDGDCPCLDEKEGTNTCHPDLINALQKLAPHLAILGDFYSIKKPPKDEEELTRFFVTGYSLGGKKGFEGITLKGYRSNTWGGITPLNPFILWESTPENTYPLIADVKKHQEAVQKEVVLYFKEGKRGDPELFGAGTGPDVDDEDNDAEGEGDSEEEKLRRRNEDAGKRAQAAAKNPDSGTGKPKGTKGRRTNKNKDEKVKEMSAYSAIPKADADAMERVKNDGLNRGETKEDGATATA